MALNQFVNELGRMAFTVLKKPIQNKQSGQLLPKEIVGTLK